MFLSGYLLSYKIPIGKLLPLLLHVNDCHSINYIQFGYFDRNSGKIYILPKEKFWSINGNTIENLEVLKNSTVQTRKSRRWIYTREFIQELHFVSKDLLSLWFVRKHHTTSHTKCCPEAITFVSNFSVRFLVRNNIKEVFTNKCQITKLRMIYFREFNQPVLWIRSWMDYRLRK